MNDPLKTTLIWICGLLGSGLLGYLVGEVLGAVTGQIMNTYDQTGMLAFMFLFACLRLWLKS